MKKKKLADLLESDGELWSQNVKAQKKKAEKMNQKIEDFQIEQIKKLKELIDRQDEPSDSQQAMVDHQPKEEKKEPSTSVEVICDFVWPHSGFLANKIVAYRHNKVPELLNAAKTDFDNTDWQTCWINALEIFQMHDQTNKCRIVKYNEKKNYYNIRDRRKRMNGARGMSNCFIPSENSGYILSIGGIKEDKHQKLVSLLQLKNDTWRNTSQLNHARAYASSCYHGKDVYVFCGHQNGLPINSIEAVSSDIVNQNTKARWRLIELEQGSISPRYHFVVSPLNSTQILIMGGTTDGSLCLSDILLFNTDTQTMTT